LQLALEHGALGAERRLVAMLVRTQAEVGDDACREGEGQGQRDEESLAQRARAYRAGQPQANAVRANSVEAFDRRG
jgi:hypothetical protein